LLTSPDAAFSNLSEYTTLRESTDSPVSGKD